MPSQPRLIDIESNGIRMTPAEFDAADFDECWHYELIDEKLIVWSFLAMSEADINDELGSRLRNYQANGPQGTSLDVTIPERHLKIGRHRYHVNRVLWTGLRRLPRKGDRPAIVVDFVSPTQLRSEAAYRLRFDDFSQVGIKEYWVIDRYQHHAAIYQRRSEYTHRHTTHTGSIYITHLLPGFVLPLANLYAMAARWPLDDES